MQKKYSDEFKLFIINDYYNSALGVSDIASKYNLSSKNYINNRPQKKLGGISPRSYEENYLNQ